MPPSPAPETFDLIVAGSGAAGLSAALRAAEAGLSVCLLEKTAQVGGTTAYSEGMAWIPLARPAREAGVTDTLDAAEAYLLACSGPQGDPTRIRAYVRRAADAADFLDRAAGIRFRLARGSADYYPDLDGWTTGVRAYNPEPFDARRLSRADLALVRSPLPTMMLLGGMSVVSFDVPDYYAAATSPRSALRVAGHVLRYAADRATGWPRGTRLGNGNGLVAAFLCALRRRGVTIRTGTAVRDLVTDGDRVAGVVTGDGRRLHAQQGVILTTGSFSRSAERMRQYYPHAEEGHTHLGIPPEGSDGDSLELGTRVGGAIVSDLSAAALWAPTSRVPMPDGSDSYWPHFSDRAKPGVIVVDEDGHRFVNEACTYRDFVAAMIARRGNRPDIAAWAIFDHHALRTYGFGPIGPRPIPLGRFLRSGYLKRGADIAALARETGIDAGTLHETVTRYNTHAAQGADPDFRKGESLYDRGNGDGAAAHPNLRPLDRGPFYAIRMQPGDLGTFVGLRTDAGARVLRDDGTPVPGLYAAGNAAASFAGGSYPAAGITIGTALVFGFLAAETASAKASTPTPAASA
jgi:succinate dehydrogenase/fumarate reductase flavoprotein subunit